MATSEQIVTKKTLGLGTGQPFPINSGQVTIVPGTTQKIINHTVIDDDKILHQILVTTNGQVRWEFKVGGVLRASGRTGMAKKDSWFEFFPSITAVITSVLTLDVISIATFPESNVEAYLQTSLKL